MQNIFKTILIITTLMFSVNTEFILQSTLNNNNCETTTSGYTGNAVN
jgi:hypothetical protein